MQGDRTAADVYCSLNGQEISFSYDQSSVDIRIHKEFFDTTPLERFGELEICQFTGEISFEYYDVIHAIQV